MAKQHLQILFLLLLISTVCTTCFAKEVLINVKDLPYDSVIEISGQNPITIVIPNRNYTNHFNLKFDGSKKFINSSVGCAIYSFNMTLEKPYYIGNSSRARTDIQNFLFLDRTQYRVPDNRCVGIKPRLFPTTDNLVTYCNCSTFYVLIHSGHGTQDDSVIPDEYYPMVIHLSPRATSYSNQFYCGNLPFSCSLKYCGCSANGGTWFDEKSFFFPPENTTSSLSLAKTISHHKMNIYLVFVLFVAVFVLY